MRKVLQHIKKDVPTIKIQTMNFVHHPIFDPYHISIQIAGFCFWRRCFCWLLAAGCWLLVAVWLDGLLADWLDGWLADWLDGWLAGWLACWLAGRLVAGCCVWVERWFVVVGWVLCIEIHAGCCVSLG